MRNRKKMRSLTIMGMLLGIAVIFGFLKIPVSDVIEFRFAYLPIALTGALFGPGAGMIVGGLSDILGYVVRPTGAFFPGFTLSSAIQGCIFGLFLYKKEWTLKRILTSHVLQTVICGAVLNTLWLVALYKLSFTKIIGLRLIKYLVMIPMEIAILYFVLKTVKRMNLDIE